MIFFFDCVFSFILFFSFREGKREEGRRNCWHGRELATSSFCFHSMVVTQRCFGVVYKAAKKAWNNPCEAANIVEMVWRFLNDSHLVCFQE